MYKNTMGQNKNTTDVCWGCIPVECVQATCHFLRALEASLPRSTRLGDNRGAIQRKMVKSTVMIVYGLTFRNRSRDISRDGRIGPKLFGAGRCLNCSVEGHGAIGQLRNSLGSVC